MAGEELKLLGSWVSPFMVRAQVALNLKGLNYEYIEEDLFNKSELLLTSNPVHKKVPVLIHNGKPLPESLIIVQYIDEAFANSGQSVLPSDPYERAIARFWGAYIDDKLFPGWAGILKAKTEGERAEKVKETLAVLEHLEEAFAKCSDGKAFFGGDTVGYVDIALGCFLGWFAAVNKITGVVLLDAGKTPRLAAWAERFGDSEAVKELIPEAERVVEYAKKLQAKWDAAAR